MIFDGISDFVKVKDYFSSKTEFALYTYQERLKKEIDFMTLSDFIQHFVDFKNRTAQPTIC